MGENLETELEYCNSNDFVKNDFGQFIYKSTDGTQTFNLVYILKDYKNWLIENNYVEQI